MNEDLRRVSRVSVCCRVVVCDRYGVWTAVTEDISPRGCQVVTNRLLRRGTLLRVTISSDLFPEELEAVGEAVWSASNRLGIVFAKLVPGAPSPEQWLAKVVEHGAMPGSGSTWRVAPSIVPSAARTLVRPIRRA